MQHEPHSQSILILGIGNYLLGDEGVGVHSVQQMQNEKFPQHVHIVDGGTGGFHLLSYFHEYETIILIDATMDDKPVGTVSVLKPRFASDFPRALSAHDIGLRDLIETAVLTRALPEIHLITISINRLDDTTTQLTPDVESAIPKVIETVLRILKNEIPVR